MSFVNSLAQVVECGFKVRGLLHFQLENPKDNLLVFHMEPQVRDKASGILIYTTYTRWCKTIKYWQAIGLLPGTHLVGFGLSSQAHGLGLERPHCKTGCAHAYAYGRSNIFSMKNYIIKCRQG